MDAAFWAKLMLDGMFAKGVGSQVRFRSQQAQFVSRYKPHERSLPGTNGAVAIDKLGNFALDFEGDLTTVTTTFVFHCPAPFSLGNKGMPRCLLHVAL